MAVHQPLTSRLHRDLAELHETPYPGVTVFIDDANIRRFCLILTPPSGAWKDLSLHFDVTIPDRWPASPPQLSCSVKGIDHPNLFGGYICCDLLKEHLYHEDGYTGGYTPALTLRGLFLQFLTFFSSTKIDQVYGRSVEIGDYLITQYARERSIAHVLTQGRYEHLHCNHLELEKEWLANTNPEVTVNTYKITNVTEPCIQKVKDLEPNPNRIHKFKQQNPRWLQTSDLISKWKCRSCPYGSDVFPHYNQAKPVVGMDVDIFSSFSPPRCYLDILNDDAVLDLVHHMPTESVISFCQAYPRAELLTRSTHVLLQRELQCFFLRTSLLESALGIGITLNPSTRSLSSDFDWLSETAFVKYKVRTSIQKTGFTYFLPLAFSPAHFKRNKAKIWSYLSVLDVDSRKMDHFRDDRTPIMARPASVSHQNIGVVFRLMNSIVVSLMKSCDEAMDRRQQSQGHSGATLLHASERAVIAYCHLFHLLICLSRQNRFILEDAMTKIKQFLLSETNRTKKHIPDLGEFIILVTLVLALPQGSTRKPLQWADFAGPFLQEAITRNVKWVLKDVPPLEAMEQGANDYRLSITFHHSRTSLRLIMFQVTFLSIFLNNYAGRLSKLDANYGFAEKSIPEKMVEEIKNIYAVSFWPDFFRKVRYVKGVQFGKEKFSEMLREAVRLSERRGYHKRGPIGALQAQRVAAERAWLSTQGVA